MKLKLEALTNPKLLNKYPNISLQSNNLQEILEKKKELILLMEEKIYVYDSIKVTKL